MNEQDWLASGDPAAMLEWLCQEYRIPPHAAGVSHRHPRHPSGRKLRLWVEACREAEGVLRGGPLYDRPWSGWDLDTPGGLQGAVEAWRSSVADGAVPTAPARAALLRDVVGDPFRPVTPPALPHAAARLLPWELQSLARAAYEGRLAGGTLDPARLLVLADALEEAGACCPRCDSWGIDTLHDGRTGRTDHAACPDCGGTGSHPLVTHLRAPGPHVRGCWALDLILGEE